MNLQEELRINDHQTGEGYAGTYLGDFFSVIIQRVGSYRIESNVYFLLSQAYTYGVIHGKRTERARRKKTK